MEKMSVGQEVSEVKRLLNYKKKQGEGGRETMIEKSTGRVMRQQKNGMVKKNLLNYNHHASY